MRPHDRAAARTCGLSLVEVLVSITVFAIAATIAMVLYDVARRSFKLGDNLSTQQQMVRIAFDMVGQDLRLAGFNTNPDGDKTRPDEQIEGAWDTAITIRADFDAERPTATVPEATLQAHPSQFPSVSTGNDEIVTYALANEASDGTLEFDVDYEPSVRDGNVEQVTVNGVATAQDDPPYTLYRITLDPDGSIVRTPLIDNVRTLEFTYYDARGQIVAAVGGLDDDDDVQQGQRARIRRITLEVEGLTRDSDLRWHDAEDPVPGPDNRGEYHKFKLVGDVIPRNLGRFGVKDLDANPSPPSTPPPPALDPGHCGGLYAVWAPNPPQDEVASYELHYGTDPDDLSGLATSDVSEIYIGGLDHATRYYVTVQAVDDSGNISDPSVPAWAETTNVNPPEIPVDFEATTDKFNKVDMAWPEVLNNAVPPPFQPSSDPDRPGSRDIEGYLIYRGLSPTFEVHEGDPTLPGQIVVALAYRDRRVVNCKNYYYRMAAIDFCGQHGGTTPAVFGRSQSVTAPKAPDNVQAFWQSGGSSIRVSWEEVRRDVNEDSIHIEDFRVFRAGPATSEPSVSSFAFVGQVSEGDLEWVNAVGTPPPGMTYYYYVRAHDYCVNESPRSQIAEATCVFDGDVVFVQATGQWVTVDVDDGTASYPLVELFYSGPGPGAFQSSGSGPPWTFAWPAQASQPGQWTLRAVVHQDNTCTQSQITYVIKP